MKGSITKYRQKNGRTSWGFHFRAGRDEAGKWIRVSKQGFSTKRQAEEELATAVKERATPMSPKVKSESFAKFFETWLKEYARRHCSPKTAERYGELGQYAIKHFGQVPIQELRPFILESAFNALLDHGGKKTPDHPNGRPLAPKTVREVAFLVYGVLKKARAWEKIEENPADFEKITLPKVEKRQISIIEKPGFKAFLAAARRLRLYPLLLLAGGTGARRGELLALQWSDISFESGIMLVTKSLEETKAGLRVKSTKSGRPRTFKVPSQAIDALREHRKQQDEDKRLFGSNYENNQLIFCRPDGSYYKPDKVSVRVTDLARKCGLPKGTGLHALRHTHASELLSKGVPIAVVSERLGHANPSITLAIYTHALKADELAAAKVWEDAMADVIDHEIGEREQKLVSRNVRMKGKNNG